MGKKIEPPGYHEVDQGDFIAKLARWYGLPHWEKIWEHPNNARLREERKTPNILFPGNLVYIPEREPKEVEKPTDQTHRFQAPRGRIKFQVSFLDGEKKPRAGVPYKIRFENGPEFEGRTPGDGRISHEIPVDTDLGVLEIDGERITIHVGHLDPIDTVSGVQARLKNLGYDPGPIDGEEGPRTRAAVRAFQGDFPPLKADGICGPKTRQKLKEIYGA
jgi:N-acetylmuramoyl-L-alanine amidase